MKRILNYLYKKWFPIEYARSLGVTVGENCRLINVSFSSEPYLVKLGDRVSATATRFETHDGGVWVLRSKLPNIDVVAPITVGSNVFIGYGSILLPGVSVGDNVVIGAHSVVSKNIPSNVVAAGIPARVIKSISDYEVGVAKKIENTKNLSPLEKKCFYENKYKGINS